MTIQRAKHREFPNVIVLWPHTVTGSAEHLRRLLYNAVTRAQNHCTVIVLGQGRTMFEGLRKMIDLKRTRSRPFRNGMVFNVYEPKRP